MHTAYRLRGADSHATAMLSAHFQCPPTIARILVARGLDSVDSAEGLLSEGVTDLSRPDLLTDIGLAIERIAHAIVSDEAILIFGDFDADGLTAAAIMFEFIRAAGVRSRVYIPNRLADGYGFQPSHLHDGSIPSDTKLIVTVDCGISSGEAVAEARRLGIDTVVTDHHQVPEVLPDAIAVVNPHRRDDASGLTHLSGAGVAFYVVAALRTHLRRLGYWKNRPEPNLREFCDLVALGTMADMVPLVGDNRILVNTGLAVLQSGSRAGVAAISRRCVRSLSQIRAETLSFGINPRLNAAGRLGDPLVAFQLLTETDPNAMRGLADELDRLNKERRILESDHFDSVADSIKTSIDLNAGGPIVLSSPDWHLGLVGLVASRVVRTYGRPTILLVENGDEAKGSGRSPEGLDLISGLHSCQALLSSFGGHAQAAGLRLPVSAIPAFREQFSAAMQSEDVASDPPPVWVDDTLTFDSITPALLDWIERLTPYGQGHPEPVFASHDISVVTSAAMGNGHRRFTLRQANRPTSPVLSAVWFYAPSVEETTHWDHLIYSLQWNRWQGRKRLQLRIHSGGASD